ncbi:MAG TPA: carboxypeptidase-like regulatory domain-containing protein, partial [Thermoanaerobaculia bacterium]|nr:carboxypeptidase-like regulatory domain-containing protein [Thermoanaerobaculia bacterium]
KLIDDKKRPVASADLAAAFRVPPAEVIRKRVRSDKQGLFVIRGLDAREVAWLIRKEGFGAVSRIARLKGDLDLGEIVLTPAREVKVAIINRRKEPVASAFVRTTDGVEAKSDAQGIATLKQVPTDGFNARVTARGYLPREFRAGETVAQPVAVTMRDAARVRVRLVRASDGTPAGPGTIAVELDGSKSLLEFGADGAIDLADLDAGKLSLELRAAGLAPFRLPPRKIADGEVVDLGVIRLDAGLSIAGRILDGTSGAPLAGATVHVLRPSAFGPLLSFVRQDWISTESSIDGTFRAGGLAPAVYSLWIEAPDHAPVIRNGIEVRGTETGAEASLGDVALPLGRTLNVICEPAARCGTSASVLIAGADWMPLTAPIQDGAASIAPVPPGTATLRLSDVRGVVHERDVAISDDPTTDVHIKLSSIDVAGIVTRGGKPASGGTVLFKTSTDSARFVQVEQKSAAGSLGSDFFGTIPRTFVAAVSDDGRFELHDATPGDYSVTWSIGGAQSQPRRVTISDGSADVLRIDLPGSGVEGIVRAGDGALPAQVLVTAEQNGARAQVFVAPDGTFSLNSLASGPVAVRASTREARAEKSLTLDENQTAHVELTLEPREDRALTVAVRANGAPVPNAFVFLRENGFTSAATTAGDGTATLRLTRRDGTFEAAVYSPLAGWAFVAPRSEADASELAVDLGSAPGAIEVESKGGRSPFSLLAPSGFPLQEAMSLLGIPATTPLRLDRLPTGRYSVTSRGAMQAVELTDGLRRVELAQP